jgi:N6-adenosine-specific RNA methylase IME4
LREAKGIRPGDEALAGVQSSADTEAASLTPKPSSAQAPSAPHPDRWAAELARFPQHHYGAIGADPAWRFRTYDKAAVAARGSGRVHYKTMDIERIANLPVGDLAAPDCALFLWVNSPLLIEGLAVMKRWGFTYKSTAFVWGKIDQAGKPRIGNGYATRKSAEICLLGTKGHPKRLNADVRELILEPRHEHSRKPDRINSDIERLFPGPYLELFARQRRPNWDSWGDQTDHFAGE